MNSNFFLRVYFFFKLTVLCHELLVVFCLSFGTDAGKI